MLYALSMSQFSEKLKEKIKDYAFNKFGRVISDEEAEEYLRSLADLYLIFHAIEKRKYQRHGGRN